MTPKARAQEALDDFKGSQAWNAKGTQYHITDENMAVIREALALSAAIERVPDGHRTQLTRMATREYWEMRITGSSCPDENGGTVYGEGESALQAILAALEALEKHAAAVKHSQEKI